MTRLSSAVLALAMMLALSTCSATTDPARIQAAGCGAVCTVSFDGSHVDADAWAEAAAGEGVVILDVRTPAEYAEGHIAGAINVDLNSGSFESEVAALDPEASYAVYCHSGNRSSQAIDIMTTLGISQTIGLKGGIATWAATGYTVTKT